MVRGTSPLVRQALPDVQPVRVLVVDDNPGFRESLVSLLEHRGAAWWSDRPARGAEALDLVPTLEPDVVLMDVRMPQMDGIEATRQLKTRFPDIGIVALTGMEDQHAVRDMLVAGASGYVLKDSDGDEILTAVLQAASGGGVISPEVTPSVIEELTEALERERRRARELEIAQEALHRTSRAAARARLAAGSRAPDAGDRDPRDGADADQGRRRAPTSSGRCWSGSRLAPATSRDWSSGWRRRSSPGSPSGRT